MRWSLANVGSVSTLSVQMAPEHAMADVPAVLERSALFARASQRTREIAASAAVVIVARPGSVVLREGAASEALFVIRGGHARLERQAAGGRGVVPLGYRGAGEVLGECCLGASKVGVPATVGESAVTLGDTVLVRIPLDVARGLLATDDGLGAALLALLLARQRRVESRVGSLLSRNVEGRLIEFLLDAVDRWGVTAAEGTLIEAPLTHLEIARSIGSTRETVTLALGSLRRGGLLDVAGRRIIVKDRGRLAAR
jgi:CRP-like cAMP-binding protein